MGSIKGSFGKEMSIGKGIKKAGGFWQGKLGQVFGSRDDSGIFGTGQYKTGTANIDETAFTDQKRSDQRRAEMAEAMKKSGMRKGAAINTAKADLWRGKQQQLADTLGAQMRGEGPTVAGLQQKQGLNQALANANSMAAGMRGVSPAMALRLTQQQQGLQTQQGVNDASMLRAQEQMSAQQQMGGLLSDARGADLSTASANQQAEIAQRAANDAQERFYREGTLGVDERDRQAKIDLQKERMKENVGIAQVNSGAYADAAARRGGAMGGIGAAVGAIFSDKNLKTDVEGLDWKSLLGGALSGMGQAKKKDGGSGLGSGISSMISGLIGGGGGGALGGASMGAAGIMSDRDIKGDISPAKSKEFLNALKAYSYRYKEPEKFGEGQKIGVMAQDLEKSQEGEKLVTDTPEGKMVDYSQAAPVMLASQAMLNERMNDMESMLKRRSQRKGVANAAA